MYMTKIDIFSGFLGAGKTTLIRKLIQEAYAGEKLVLIENEFGEIGIDGGFLQEAGVAITEMNSGCICCSLVGDFSEALKKVLADFAPDRVLIEPSGVGKLSDVIRAVENVDCDTMQLNSFTTVVDAKKAKMYMKNFGEFFNDQVSHAATIILSHTDGMDADKLAAVTALLREHNSEAVIVTTPWSQLDGKQILEAAERTSTLETELHHLAQEVDVCPTCGHHHHHDHDHECECHEHHHHDHDHECECHEHHHHDHDHECECHEHHHHDHDHECECHEHHHHDHDHECECHEHHHHDHDHECECGCHEHHHHHHHADDVFQSFGRETTRAYTAAELETMLKALEDEHAYGQVLRAKGIVAGEDGWLHFDYVPGEADVRQGAAGVIGRLCVIGAGLNESALERLFAL